MELLEEEMHLKSFPVKGRDNENKQKQKYKIWSRKSEEEKFY